MLALMQDVGHKLRVYDKNAGGVAIDIRNSKLSHRQWQCQIPPTHSTSILAREAFSLFSHSYRWDHPIRSVNVRAINLSPLSCPQQIDLWTYIATIDKMERLDATVAEYRESPNGPKRKYFSITLTGVEELQVFFLSWQELHNAISMLFETGGKENE